MPLPERVLIDTSAFYALVSASDDFHQQARQNYERLVDWGQELWTTSYVLVETCALVHRRLGFETLHTLMESLQGIVQVWWVESSLHNEAWQRLVQSRGAGLGLVDWTTALVAQRLRAYVFTFDMAFAAQGVAVLPR